MMHERLETRRLMSVTFDPVARVVTGTGTAGNDTILVTTPSPTTVRVSTNGVGRTFARSNVRGITLKGLAGNDALRVSALVAIPVRLDGGTGVDYLLGGGGDDTLLGGDGNDVAEGGNGWDHLYGGTGNDTLRGNGGQDDLWGGAGNDLLDGGYGADDIDGGTGSDTVDYSRRTEAVSIYLRVGTVPSRAGGLYNGSWEHDWVAWDNEIDPGRGDLFAGVENARGGSGDDTIVGTDAGNRLWGNGGNDTIAGNDRFPGDPGSDGADELYGGAGNDILRVEDGAGDDFVDGGAGFDVTYVDDDAGGVNDVWTNVEARP